MEYLYNIRAAAYYNKACAYALRLFRVYGVNCDSCYISSTIAHCLFPIP